MKKRIIVILASLLVVVIAGFIYLKYFYLQTKDFEPDNSKAKNILDLRPAIIAKLQQLVKDGSNGLYVLSIEKIDPDIIASTLEVFNAHLRVDSAAMLQLDKQEKLPDDIFDIHFDSLHIDGLGLQDLLNKKSIDISRLNVIGPAIEIYHTARAYNQSDRERNDTLSLYQKIKGQMNSIGIGQINIEKGTLVVYNDSRKKNVTKLSHVNIHINDLLVDSTTQYDASRVLFAKELNIDAKDYLVATPDSLYYFKTNAVSIIAAQHKLVLHDVEMKPRGTKEQFQSKLKYQKEMFHLLLKRVEFNNVDWWSLMDRDKFIATQGQMSAGYLKVYLDRSLPAAPLLKTSNFPHQLLMRVPMPIMVDHIAVKDLDVSYEEYNPASRQSATVFFDKLSGQIDHASNIASYIKVHPIADVAAEGMFMHNTPVKAAFKFDLSRYKSGGFTVDFRIGALNNATINSISNPLGMASVKSGDMQEITVHIKGDNFKTNCKLAIAYTDLHITPLKKAGEDGKVKKKHTISFIANTFLIKNANPKKGEALRQPEFTVQKDHYNKFFHFIWTTTLTGIVKTIGVPLKLVPID